MNIVRFPRLLNRSAFVVTLIGSVFILSACGGDDNDDKSSSSSSSISSSSSSSAPSRDAIWPDINAYAESPKTLTFSWTPVEGATTYQLFKNVDGSSGYEKVGSPVSTTTATDTVDVHLFDSLNGRYMVEACSADGCENSSPVDISAALVGAIGYIKASNTDANDWFGWSLDLSADGTTLVVAAPTEDSNALGINGDQTSNTSSNAGAIYVFELTNGVWAQQAYIKASNTEQPNSDALLVIKNDRFGYRVSLSDDGNTLAVAALNEDSFAVGVGCNQENTRVLVDGKARPIDYNIGAVYVFSRTGSEWSQEAYIKPTTIQTSLQFGNSLALSADGNTLAVSALAESYATGGVGSSSFSSTPEFCENANPILSSSSSSSSTSSSSSSSTPSSSSSSANLGGATSGAVYLYQRTDGNWAPQAYIKASNAGAGDQFGTSLALSADGNTLAVGAPGEDMAPDADGKKIENYRFQINYATSYEINAGAVYLFNRTSDDWSQSFYVKPNHISWGMQFGTSVDLSDDGSLLAVGANSEISRATGIDGDPQDYDLLRENSLFPGLETGSTASASGAAYLFTFNGSTWAQTTYFKASNAEAGDQFGRSVKLAGNGDYLVVGAFSERSTARGINGDEENNSAANTGAVYVFGQDAGSWRQLSYVKPSNTDGGERFGSALGISADGSTMAVGAYREASKATGVNGDQNDNSAPSAGAVYLF